MARRERMDKTAFASLVDDHIATAQIYATNSLYSVRDKALEYVRGEMRDLPSERGKSSLTDRSLSDVLGWIMPSMLRVFLSSDTVARFEPTKREMGQGPNGEEIDLASERADQASDYINYVFLTECGGYRVLHSAIYDGLLLGNGTIKHWWQDEKAYAVEEFSGLSDDQFTQIASDDDVEEVTEHSILPGPEGIVHACKVKRVVATGCLRCEAVPPEEILIGRGDLVLDETTVFAAHRFLETRSELIKRGYDKETVEGLPAGGNTLDFDGNQRARDPSYDLAQRNSMADKATELIEVYECYVLADVDGDGVAERRKVVKVRGRDGTSILEDEEWGDDLPFTDLVPDPVPHRWRGRSLYEEVEDIQRAKTVILRQTLDNLYLTNNPMAEVVQNQIVNMDALVNRQIGGNIFVKSAGAINWQAVPFAADKSFAMLAYFDEQLEKRTGVSRATMALDMDALSNQTATATNAATAAAATKSETYARNMAESGMKRLFRCLLKLVIQHQDRPRTIRLRGKWVDMNPTDWDAGMDVTINTGLGSGSRDRDVALLGAVAQKQEMILQLLGPDNPVCDLETYRNTLAKGVEAAGLRSPEQYFKEITPEAMQQFAQAQSQKPDPKMQEAQARIQLEGQKAVADHQLKQQTAAADSEHRMMELNAKMEHERERAALENQLARDRAAADIETARQKAEVDIQLAREKAQQDAALKVEELRLEAELKRESMKIERQAQQANIEEASPQ